MDKKIIKYLSKRSTYTNLDKVLLFYVSGQFNKVLNDNNATNIEFFPSIGKNNSIQVYFKYYNLFAILDFNENYYEYCKYEANCSAKELEDKIIKTQYNDDFDIEIVIKNFIQEIDNDKNLNKLYVNKKSQKKLYSILSIFSIIMPWIILGIIALCSYLMDKEIKLGAWFGIIIVIAIVLWYIFDNKSKK